MNTQNFWTRFDTACAVAKASKNGRRLVAAGFETEHTGGGCTAWIKHTSDRKHHVLVCDGGNGFGEYVADGFADWLVGLYDREGLWFLNPEDSMTLDAAIRWANDAIYAMEVV